MNKTPKINRLFLVTVIWILLSGFSGIYPVCSFDGCDAADAFEPASVFDAVIGFMIINKVDPRKWMPFKPLKYR